MLPRTTTRRIECDHYDEKGSVMLSRIDTTIRCDVVMDHYHGKKRKWDAATDHYHEKM